MTRISMQIRPALAAALIFSAAACAKNTASSTSATRAQETSGQITQTESLKATVQEVDAEKRIVTLTDEHGKAFALDVGANVDLASIHPQDAVRVSYQESVAFALSDQAQAEVASGPAVEETTRSVPEGVQFARKVSTTVEIVSVTQDGAQATFRIPEGTVRTVQINDAPSQKKIANLRQGDEVAVSYTEKLAVALDPAD